MGAGNQENTIAIWYGVICEHFTNFLFQILISLENAFIFEILGREERNFIDSGLGHYGKNKP